MKARKEVFLTGFFCEIACKGRCRTKKNDFSEIVVQFEEQNRICLYFWVFFVLKYF